METTQPEVKLPSNEEFLADVVDLCIFLARPLGGNRPIFATEDWWGNPLPGNIRLQQTWDLIFGTTGRTPPGAYRQCPTCKTWGISNENDHDRR